MKNKQHHPKRRFPAFGMMESLISLVVIVIVTSLFSSTYLAVDTAKFESKNQSRAQQILSESVEAIRSIRDQSFLDLQNGTHGLHYEANLWNFTGSEDTVDDRFTRKVTIDPIYRNNTGDIDPEGTILDDRSKAIHVQVSWESDQEGSREIETQYSISDSYAFEGIDTTEQDWNNGTHNQTESTDTGDGALALERYQLCPGEVIAHWSFDDAYRPEWENRNRYQAVSVGAVWSDKAQRKGAMQFDGVDDYEDMGTNVDITGKELTITAWIKADKAESNPEIIAKSKGLDPGDTLWSLGLETGTSKQASLRFILKTDQGNSTKLVGGSITLGQWTQ
ncbi:MAG: LamG-like jellyroll fold domain-containing protein, partial [Candidatus Gracilibacteria bacterium]|nr:LamG-like jellyroll fold domain-containing protein [Candidatus Gracilibacteria bacterium]